MTDNHGNNQSTEESNPMSKRVFGTALLLALALGLLFGFAAFASGDENGQVCYGDCPTLQFHAERQVCPAGYHQSQLLPNKCVKGPIWDLEYADKITETFDVDVPYIKSEDPGKCHRPSPASLDVPSWAADEYNEELPEHLDAETVECPPPPEPTPTNTPEPTPTPLPTPEPGKVVVSVEASWCRDDHKPLRKVIISINPAGGATVQIDLNDTFTGSGGDVFLDEGEHNWSAQAADGYELQGPSSGTIKIKSCADQPDEHPKTGGGSEPLMVAVLVGAAVVLLGAGVGILLTRRA